MVYRCIDISIETIMRSDLSCHVPLLYVLSLWIKYNRFASKRMKELDLSMSRAYPSHKCLMPLCRSQRFGIHFHLIVCSTSAFPKNHRSRICCVKADPVLGYFERPSWKHDLKASGFQTLTWKCSLLPGTWDFKPIVRALLSFLPNEEWQTREEKQLQWNRRFYPFS